MAFSTAFRSEGNEGATMPAFHFMRSTSGRVLLRALAAVVWLSACLQFCRLHPRRRHRRHRRQGHRRQRLARQQRQRRRLRGLHGRRQLPDHDRTERPLLSRRRAKSFRQLQTPDFYAGQFDSIERNLVLEPAWVRESIVVTATGTPTPQPQTSAATTVLGPLDLALRDDLVSALRLMPGTEVVQTGQLGAQSSLFVRGGDSDDNKILLDGVDAGDLGKQLRLSGRFPPRPSRAPKSIAVPIPASTAQARTAASSA